MSPRLPIRLFGTALIALLAVAACAPAAQRSAAPGQPVDDAATFGQLVAPFHGDLSSLGVSVRSFQAYRFGGGDESAFIRAINAFYLQNPGFCPLENAFYAAPNGLQFMTLAGNNGVEVRGFLYDQSHRPQLTYAYFAGTSETVLPAIVCKTASSER